MLQGYLASSNLPNSLILIPPPPLPGSAAYALDLTPSGVASIKDAVAQTEAELRWQCWHRFSLVGFAGGGVAWNDFASFDQTRTIVTGGTGFRYELARKYGLHMGSDVGFGPNGSVLYIQFGSAWMRP